MATHSRVGAAVGGTSGNSTTVTECGGSRSAPPDAPNRFLVGVQPDQLAEVQQFFSEKKIAVPELYPMIRGRLPILAPLAPS